jgi:hypothetical protein
MEDCVVYLVFQLRNSGFEVRFTWPNLLWISWRHTEGEYLTKQNPIVQAMIPEPPPKPQHTSQKKGKQAAANVSFAPTQEKAYNEVQQPTGRMIQSSSFGISPLTATPRSAADYKPPDTFVQQLERPTQPAAKQSNSGNILTDLWNF